MSLPRPLRLPLAIPLLAAALAVACSPGLEAPGEGAGDGHTLAAGVPAGRALVAPAGESLPAAISTRTTAQGPAPLALAELPAEAPEELLAAIERARPGDAGGDGPERPISEEEVERLRAEALDLPPSARLRRPDTRAPGLAAPGLLAPSLGTGFSSLTYTGFVPPDPEVAVGPNHIVAVVNASYAVYDKTGSLLAGPASLQTFFNSSGGTPGCEGGVFDPNVLYDEEANRFLLGVDGGGTSYCIAATVGASPTGSWNRYAFETDYGGPGFDFPHAGVGREAIYLGSNQFTCLSGGCTFIEGRVYAIDKWALYAGEAAAVVTHSTGATNSTPQPANLHGYLQGTWPAAGPHYILTERYDGEIHSLWSWEDPFGDDLLTLEADLDVEEATGVAAGFPVTAPQLGAATRLESNDWRGLDTEYRNGRLWMTNNIACNPGGGTVDCVRWAEIDPTVPEVVQAGVSAGVGDYFLFPDLAVNDCGDMAVGYTKTSATIHPAVWAAGRRSFDAQGALASEVELKAGEGIYSAFDGSPFRWGDYTGMTVDPDGLVLWYLGEYSNTGGLWSTWVHPLIFPDCPLAPSPEGAEFGAVEVFESSLPVEFTLFNLGSSTLEVDAMGLSNATDFSLNEFGGSSPCGSLTPVLAALTSCTVEVTFNPASQAVFVASLEISYPHPLGGRTVPLAGIGYFPCPYSASETLTNGAPENGSVSVQACQTIAVGPYQLGSLGDLSVLAGLSVSFANGTAIEGDLEVALDPFLALP